MWIENCAATDVAEGKHRLPGPNSMLIQISDPAGYVPEPKHSFGEIHKFEFLDLDDVDLRRDPALEDFVVSKTQVKEMARILVHAKDKGMNVVVHCYVGVSRSGAVAEAGVLIGFDDAGNLRTPNKRLLNMLANDLFELEKDV